jgi:histidyl-tRNA synthetase
MAHTKPARGMRDFLPADVRRRAYVIGIVTDVYQRYGFEPLETPAVENLETLMGKYGEEGNQLVFRIQKRGEEFERALDGVRTSAGTPGDLADLALRYDLTVPLARVVAEYRGVLPKFFKRYQIQPVWRADRPARGRFREFYQCDVDILGTKSVIVEAELCAAVSEVLTRLGFKDFVIRMNHRQVLSAMLNAAGVPAERSGDALVALDKLDKIGRAGVEQEFTTRGIDPASATRLLDLFERLTEPDAASARVEKMVVAAGFGEALPEPDRTQRNTRALAKLADFIGHGQPDGNIGLVELQTIIAYAAATPARGRIAIDPSLARGLSYYTGAIMEIAVPDLAGSLGGGGRYDNLVGMFLDQKNQDVPACGFSLGLERIIVVMTERGMFPPGIEAAPAQVMVTIWNAARIADSLALANELRAAGLQVDLYPEADKIGKQFKYASTRGIPKVAILGDDEVARGEVALKDMVTGEQRTVPRADVAAAVRSELMARA